jgi:hypothetical protein
MASLISSGHFWRCMCNNLCAFCRGGFLDRMSLAVTVHEQQQSLNADQVWSKGAFGVCAVVGSRQLRVHTLVPLFVLGVLWVVWLLRNDSRRASEVCQQHISRVNAQWCCSIARSRTLGSVLLLLASVSSIRSAAALAATAVLLPRSVTCIAQRLRVLCQFDAKPSTARSNPTAARVNKRSDLGRGS